MGAASSFPNELTEKNGISANDIEYLESSNVLQPVLNALKSVSHAKPDKPLLQVCRYLENEVHSNNFAQVCGFHVQCNKYVRLLTGPIVGDVTWNAANILIEVVGKESLCAITCHLLQKGDKQEVLKVQKNCHSHRPACFRLENLQENSQYCCVFSGLSRGSALKAFAYFKTKQQHPKQFKIVALSCDRPTNLYHGQINPWKLMSEDVDSVDCMLHLGDQVYMRMYTTNEIDDFMETLEKEYDQATPEKQEMMMQRGRELSRRKYRQVFGMKEQQKIYRHSSHLMIWSDNDVANDFTTLKKKDGTQAYHPAFLQCAMEVYREYQRLLWDHECIGDLPFTDEPLQEWHSHIYGEVGIFLIDMRGNRINGKGVQLDAPLMSPRQWQEFEEFINNDELKVIVVCSEIPFVTDPPDAVKKNAAKIPFLVDHWAYNDSELVKILELVFSWKAAKPNREALLMGGDVHSGNDSIIRDAETGMEIQHLTTSPITNEVSPFFSAMNGKVNERFSFEHNPLGQEFRNWAEIVIDLDEKTEIKAKLVPVSTNEYAEMDWCSSDEEEK